MNNIVKLISKDGNTIIDSKKEHVERRLNKGWQLYKESSSKKKSSNKDK